MADSKLTIVTRLPNDILRAKVDSFVKHQKLAEPGYSMNTLVVDAIRAWIEPKGSAAPPMLAPQPQAPEPRTITPKPKGWLSELQRLMRLKEIDPEEAGREEAALLQGFKAPKGWQSMNLEQRAAYLDRVMPFGGVEPSPAPGESGITKANLEQSTKPVPTLADLMASGKVSRGIPKPSEPAADRPAAGTQAPAADPDGW